jgi:soluble lytic murein transglycosylase
MRRSDRLSERWPYRNDAANRRNLFRMEHSRRAERAQNCMNVFSRRSVCSHAGATITGIIDGNVLWIFAMSRSLRLFLIMILASVCMPAAAQPTDAQRLQMRTAIETARRVPLDSSQTAALRGHPLYPWLEYANLSRNLDQVDTAQAQDFLNRYDGQAVADLFRERWLPVLAKRRDWGTLLQNWRTTDNVALRCANLQAQDATRKQGNPDAGWINEAQAIWRSGSKSLPDLCNPVFARLAESGGLLPALRWERIDAAAAAHETSVMRHAARGLPADEAALAGDYAAFIDSPDPRALNWPKTERSRRMAAIGLARMARKDPDMAELQLPRYAEALGFTEAERGQVLYQIALWTVASYLPDSARRLDSVPESAYDERLHEWRVREALARGDWPAALAGLRKMPAAQRNDSRWRYFEARMLEKTGDATTAQALYRQAAVSPTFHGFLAADRLNQAYRLCPWQPQDSAQAKAQVASDPAIVRAVELFKIEEPGWAVREWNAALARFDDTQRRIAVEVARDNGWFDRAVFSLGKQPDEQRLYELRFPLSYTDLIRREAAKNALDPAWIAAEIRAESIFNPKARSSANAMGLMQVLPSTGAKVAKDIGLTAYTGAASLYDPEINITLGTAYLRQKLNNYGLPYVAIAAYNAGPTPTGRWLSQRPNYDPDLWIETISYKETREYVARVLAFSVIYDWRMSGDALPVSDRLAGRIEGRRKAFTCPSPGR